MAKIAVNVKTFGQIFELELPPVAPPVAPVNPRYLGF